MATNFVIRQVPRYEALRNALALAQNPIRTLDDTVARYGHTFYSYIGGVRRMLLTVDPGLIQHVLQRRHRYYEKSYVQTELLGKYAGKGLLTNTGDDWRTQRRLIQPGFHRERLHALHRLMCTEIEACADALHDARMQQPVLDLYPHMLNVAFRVVAQTLYSGAMDEGELHRMSYIITRLQEHFINELRLPFLKPFFVVSGRQRYHQELSKEGMALQMKMLQKRRNDAVPHDDLLQMLMEARYEDNGQPMTDKQLIEEALILFVAGHETSANALSWTFYLLSQHPAALEQLLAELDAVCPGRMPTFEELRQLPWLTQVIEEAMRLYPPAWITDRVALEPDTYEGQDWPTGTIVSPYIYGVHHNPEWWDAPASFLPERFAADKKKNHHPYQFMPFGGGPRLCIGNSFAMMEMQLTLACFLRRFKFDYALPKPPEAQALVTLRPKHGVMMHVTEKKTTPVAV